MSQSRGPEEDMPAVASSNAFSFQPLGPGYLSSDMEALEEQMPLFETPARTKQLAETHYWKRNLADQTASLVPANAFWADFARYQATGDATPFLSKNILEAGGSFTGSMLALAVMDLPFEAETEEHAEGSSSERHSFKVSGPSLSFSPSWPLIIFEEGIRELPPVPAGSSTSAPSLLASHILLEVQPSKNEAYENATSLTIVRGDSVQTGKVYAIAVVLVRMSVEDEDINASILIQIPKGAVPLSPKGYTVCEPLTDRFFSGKPVIVTAFYFPRTGKYPQLPAQVFQRRKDAAVSGGAPRADEAGEMELVAVAVGAVPELTVISDEEVEAAAVAKGAAEGWGDGPQAWPAISSHATADQLLRHLSSTNLHAPDLSMMAWRMREPRFCAQALAVLRERHVYSNVLSAYGVMNGDETATREVLQHSKRIASLLKVPVFESPILQLQPGATGLLTSPEQSSVFEHTEYHPLLNSRVHAFGENKEGIGRIQNKEFAQQYTRLLEVCSRKKHLSCEETLQAAYCFLLQDRVDEAKAMYERAVSAAPDPTNPRPGITIRGTPASTPPSYARLQMQADYLAAYLDFFSSDPAASIARQVAAAYRECPIPLWRERFAEIEAQLSEAEEEVQGLLEKDDEDASWEMLEKDAEESLDHVDTNTGKPPSGPSAIAPRGKRTPVLELRQLSDGSLLAEYAYIDSLSMNVYILDLELLFSDNPFVSHDTDAFTVIMPNWSSTVDTRGGGGKGEDRATGAGPRKKRGSTAVEIPEEHRTRNVLVEVTGGGLRRTFVRYSTTAVWVEVMEGMGELKVMQRLQNKPEGRELTARASMTGAPMRGAYVKVFARMKDKKVAFYKDGYTDRRGHFDYASVSTGELEQVERFSLLVIADGLGSLIKEAAPPAR